MFSWDDKIHCLERIIQTYIRNKTDFHMTGLTQDIAILKEILEDEESLKWRDSGNDW